jgi:hypothetical protein
MTGIYGGFLFASGYLAVRDRYRAWRLPPPATLAMLGLFVGALAFDGFNSLLLDLALPHPYPPDNRIRLATGLLTGIALAVILCYLLATTLWRDAYWQRAVVSGPRELAMMVALTVPFALAALSRVDALYVPVATALLLSAVAVVAAMMLVVTVLVRQRDRTFASLSQLHATGTVALLLALVVMAGLSGGRFWLEQTIGIVPLP